jgi:hypothetical protein
MVRFASQERRDSYLSACVRNYREALGPVSSPKVPSDSENNRNRAALAARFEVAAETD